MVTDSSNTEKFETPDLTPQKHEWRDLDEGRRPTYGDIKKKFKAEFMGKAQGFVLSEHVANQLSVEQEEKNKFEKRVKDDVEARLTIIKAEAYQKGLAQGLEEGLKKAYEEEKARLAVLMEKLTLAGQDLIYAKKNLQIQYEKTLVDLSFRVAEVVLHQRVEEHPESVSSAIRAVLERISREEDVRVRLNSFSFDGIEAIKKDLDSIAREGRVLFELDQRLPKGACVVESQGGEYASFVNEKIDILKKSIFNRIESEEEDLKHTKVGS